MTATDRFDAPARPVAAPAPRPTSALDIELMSGDALRRDVCLRAEQSLIEAPSYGGASAILACELADGTHLYIRRDAD